MAGTQADHLPVTPQLLLRAYASGLFPMADARDDPELFWVEPKERGIFPLDRFHVPRRLVRRLFQPSLTVTIDGDFAAVIDACASPAAGRSDTWINAEIRQLFLQLFAMGQAHSVAVYEQDRLIGGLYGLRLGAAFFGESMFSQGRDGSKIALVHTAAHLARLGFELFDCQFWTPHLSRFGCIAIAQADYRQRLARTRGKHRSWQNRIDPAWFQSFVQASTQTS